LNYQIRKELWDIEEKLLNGETITLESIREELLPYLRIELGKVIEVNWLATKVEWGKTLKI
jgi:hypothetical protein